MISFNHNVEKNTQIVKCYAIKPISSNGYFRWSYLNTCFFCTVWQYYASSFNDWIQARYYWEPYVIPLLVICKIFEWVYNCIKWLKMGTTILMFYDLIWKRIYIILPRVLMPAAFCVGDRITLNTGKYVFLNW